MKTPRHISSQPTHDFLAECCRENANSRFLAAGGMLVVALTVAICCLWVREWNHWDFTGFLAVLFLGAWARHTIQLGILDKYQAEQFDEQAEKQAKFKNWERGQIEKIAKAFQPVAKLSGAATRGTPPAKPKQLSRPFS